MGAVAKDGYGNIGSGPAGAPTLKAHRVSYEIYREAIPEGMCVLHKCDTPLCVNPDHLFLGTRSDNARDKVSKGRHAVGERHGRSKLTPEQVETIKSGSFSQRFYAELFGISQSQISNIVRGKKWRAQ